MKPVLVKFTPRQAATVATKIALSRYGADVKIVNAYVSAESPDNRRFLADCERWFGRTITVVQNDNYDADPVKVWIAKRFIAGHQGASCSKPLKGGVLDQFNAPGDSMRRHLRVARHPNTPRRRRP